MLRKFKDTEGFVENVGLSRWAIYLKAGLYKFFKKYAGSKNSNPSSHYFRNNSKMIKTVPESNEELFAQKKNRTNGFINHYCF